MLKPRLWSYIETWALFFLILALVLDVCLLLAAWKTHSTIRNVAGVATGVTATVIALLSVGVHLQRGTERTYNLGIRARALKRVARYAAKHGARLRLK